MAMVVESSTQVRGCAELAHDVRMVVKHTFLELVVDDEFGVRSAQNARQTSSSEPRTPMHTVQFDKCELERKSAASTQANDTDDDDTELMLSDDEEPTTTSVQAPPGVWAQAQPQNFMPVCVAFVPVMQQPVWKKSSRSARRRRARAMNRWFRYNMQSAEGEQQEGAFDDELDAEFDDEWQLPEGEDAESPEMDAESWPMTNSPSQIVQDKKKA
jgi:hypothetical protein